MFDFLKRQPAPAPPMTVAEIVEWFGRPRQPVLDGGDAIELYNRLHPRTAFLKMLPPKPRRYRAHRTVFMVAQWVLLPFTTIAYNSLSALYSQTRLMFGKYLGKFDVTDKTVVTEKKKKVA